MCFPSTHNITNFLTYQKVSPQYKSFLTTLHQMLIPTTVGELLKYPHLREAMDEEMHALAQNHIWDIVQKPLMKILVGCRWVFTVKYRSDGTLERYTARLVAKGYTQTYGIEYKENFPPVAKMNTIRVLISLVVNLDWDMQQYDIKNAFLHEELDAEICMEIPPGYNKMGNIAKVCRLKKVLYSLKQPPRVWFG